MTGLFSRGLLNPQYNLGSVAGPPFASARPYT